MGGNLYIYIYIYIGKKRLNVCKLKKKLSYSKGIKKKDYKTYEVYLYAMKLYFGIFSRDPVVIPYNVR